MPLWLPLPLIPFIVCFAFCFGRRMGWGWAFILFVQHFTPLLYVFAFLHGLFWTCITLGVVCLVCHALCCYRLEPSLLCCIPRPLPTYLPDCVLPHCCSLTFTPAPTYLPSCYYFSRYPLHYTTLPSGLYLLPPPCCLYLQFTVTYYGPYTYPQCYLFICIGSVILHYYPTTHLPIPCLDLLL